MDRSEPLKEKTDKRDGSPNDLLGEEMLAQDGDSVLKDFEVWLQGEGAKFMVEVIGDIGALDEMDDVGALEERLDFVWPSPGAFSDDSDLTQEHKK